MIYLAESGSTKCDGVFFDDAGKNEVKRIKTMGFNPYFHSSEVVAGEMKKVPEVQQYGDQVREVYFYGAGCSSPSLNETIRNGLQEVFPNAKVSVDHDLMACAYATYSGEPAINCILGTGSNCVYFDGEKTDEGVPALAYILGDEGSASYLGKKLLAAYLYKLLPLEVEEDFKTRYPDIDKDVIVENVYQKPHANVYLANFAPFFARHKDHPFMWQIIFSGFKEFLEIHVLTFENAREVPVHFVGSVAHHYRDILANVMDHLDLKMGNVVQKPVEGLIAYHQNHIWNNEGRNS